MQLDSSFFHNNGLFNQSVFDAYYLNDAHLYMAEKDIKQSEKHLKSWESKETQP